MAELVEVTTLGEQIAASLTMLEDKARAYRQLTNPESQAAFLTAMLLGTDDWETSYDPRLVSDWLIKQVEGLLNQHATGLISAAQHFYREACHADSDDQPWDWLIGWLCDYLAAAGNLQELAVLLGLARRFIKPGLPAPSPTLPAEQYERTLSVHSGELRRIERSVRWLASHPLARPNAAVDFMVNLLPRLADQGHTYAVLVAYTEGIRAAERDEILEAAWETYRPAETGPNLSPIPDRPPWRPQADAKPASEPDMTA